MDLQVPGSPLETMWQEESQVNWNLFVLITFVCLVDINIAGNKFLKEFVDDSN